MKKSKILILIVLILILVSVSVFIINSKKTKNDNKNQNNYYNSDLKNINENDFSIDKIKLNISMDEVKSILGEPKETSEFVDSEIPENSYKRFDYENLIIQFNYENDKVNYIASSRLNFKNSRGISVGDTITDILKNYPGDKNIEIFENNYGTYEILYGKEDAMEYIKSLESKDKTFSYIYKYDGDVNSVIFVQDGNVLEFYLTENKINMMIVAEKYIAW